MTRLVICSVLQGIFVTAYGMWYALKPDSALSFLMLFIAIIWLLVIYNNWLTISTVLKHR